MLGFLKWQGWTYEPFMEVKRNRKKLKHLNCPKTKASQCFSVGRNCGKFLTWIWPCSSTEVYSLGTKEAEIIPLATLMIISPLSEMFCCHPLTSLVSLCVNGPALYIKLKIKLIPISPSNTNAKRGKKIYNPDDSSRGRSVSPQTPTAVIQWRRRHQLLIDHPDVFQHKQIQSSRRRLANNAAAAAYNAGTVGRHVIKPL